MKKYLYKIITNSFPKNSILMIMLLIFSSILSVVGQTKIKGKIIDSKTNEAIPFVNIVVLGTKQGVQTDVNGNYTFEIQDKSASKIQFSSVGYQTEIKNFKKDLSQTISFKMIPQSQNLRGNRGERQKR